MSDLATIAAEDFRPLRRKEFDRLVELGFFADEKIELLAGVLVPMSPQGAPHAHALRTLTQAFTVGVGSRAFVQVQSPLALADDAEPEPDLAVVPLGDYRKEHPSRAELIVEISDSSVRKDRLLKAEIYARASVPEYWIVNLGSGQLEVYAGPVEGRYTTVRTLAAGQTASPAAFPDIAIAVADLLGA
jgi:Uma2 family endonuclease